MNSSKGRPSGASASGFAARHSFKLMLALLALLAVLCVSLMTPYWLGQIAKYNRVLATPGGFPASLSMPPSAEVLAQGRQLFESNCIGCHGKDAGGQDPKKSLGGVYDGAYFAPALNATGHTAVHTTKALFFVAKYGSLTRANSAMRGWEGQLSDEELASIILWVRSTWPAQLQQAQGRYFDTRFP